MWHWSTVLHISVKSNLLKIHLYVKYNSESCLIVIGIKKMDKLSDASNDTLRKIANEEDVEEQSFTELRTLLNSGLISHQFSGGWNITKTGIQYLIAHNIKVSPPPLAKVY